jgi:hypothetical protein
MESVEQCLAARIVSKAQTGCRQALQLEEKKHNKTKQHSSVGMNPCSTVAYLATK